MDRRDFLKILGISSGTAMISTCGVDKANETIIPYVIPPVEEVYPDKPLFYNTTCTECPAGCGMQVKVNEKVYHDMRSLFPTKLEGIKGHPVNDGALCMRGQAGLFRLYHPDRIRRPMMRDGDGNLRVATWPEAFERVQRELEQARRSGLSNVYLSGQTTGSLSRLIDEFCKKLSVERLAEYELFSHASLKTAYQLVYGVPQIPRYHIGRSDFLLTLGADIYETFLSPVYFTAEVARGKTENNLNWVHVEPHLSLTGAQASQRLNIRPKTEAMLAGYLLRQLFRENRQKRELPVRLLQSIPDDTAAEVSEKTGMAEQALLNLKESLFRATRPLIMAGGVSLGHAAGLETGVLVALLQYAMDMTTATVDFTHPLNPGMTGDTRDMEQLGRRLDSEKIGVIFLSRTHPAETLPAASDFLGQLKKARFKIALSDLMTPAMSQCDLILPLSHALESWGDAEPYTGLRTIIRPVMDPQFESLPEGDILLQLMAGSGSATRYQDYLKNIWSSEITGENAEKLMEKGFRYESRPAVKLALSGDAEKFLQKANFAVVPASRYLVLTPSIRSYDGRSKSLPLMKELPDPLSSVTYGEWVSVSEKTADELDIKDRDELLITAGDFSVKLPARIQPYLPDDVFMVQRDLVGLPQMESDARSGEMNVYLENISVSKTGRQIALLILAGSAGEEGRGILPHDDDHALGHEGNGEWYPPHQHENYRWGMAIDLESCIGCNACAAACYVENNIPIVGAEEHLRGREMSWIRIQPYVSHSEEIEFVPMMCQHCDNAPCEPVCPVYAAYHNPEGLNVQVYNRCVGTRYCANNCPYKVRRFNWFDHRLEAPWDKMYNPAVSVRDRGIMEKCTFCIQRIRAAKDHARDEGRLVQDGEVIPACAQTCPTSAITFGNMMDENSRVYQLAHSDRAYRALEELGTQPAVNYLRKKGDHHEA